MTMTPSQGLSVNPAAKKNKKSKKTPAAATRAEQSAEEDGDIASHPATLNPQDSALEQMEQE